MSQFGENTIQGAHPMRLLEIEEVIRRKIEYDNRVYRVAIIGTTE
ncbi:hypothetical protein [Leptospira interrogans]|nr:hypothetical protein [Leptospira interrogans]